MKKFLKLKVIIFIVFIGTIINLLNGCTSIKNGIALNSSNNLNISAAKEESNNIITSLNEISTKSENNEKTITLDYDKVKDSLIRFHVIANSDNEDDQNLKIKVKNEVIDYLYPYLNKSGSIDESRTIIQTNMENVKKIVEDVIKNNNYDYSVEVELSRENFPDKSYGNIILPQGNYEAFRIIIGNGYGKNWWCVMFPPLCFVDETKAEIEYKKTENKINERQNSDSQICDLKDQEEDNGDSDQSYLDSANSKDEKDNIQIKFKIVEVIKKIFD